jgi:MFS family permease
MGLYTGATAPVRLLGGLLADRSRRHKQVAVAGYGLSTVARLGMVLVGHLWGALAGLVLVDRLGKGIRTSPRDAMISMATPRAQWGAAFGVHRALDTAGAMTGPVLAFAVLAAAPGGYDAVFVVSLCVGLIGLGIVVVYAPQADRPALGGDGPAVSLRAAVHLVWVPGLRTVLPAAVLLGLTTLGDGFLYLALQDRLGFEVGLFPLLYVATSLVFMLLAVPVGRLADRVGRGRVFVGGYLALLAVYGVLLWPAGTASAVAVAGHGRITAASADTPPGAGGYGCAVFAEENRARCDVPRLTAHATWTITVTVTPTDAGPVEGRVMTGAAEPDPVNDGVASVRTVVG